MLFECVHPMCNQMLQPGTRVCPKCTTLQIKPDLVPVINTLDDALEVLSKEFDIFIGASQAGDVDTMSLQFQKTAFLMGLVMTKVREKRKILI